MKYCIKNNEGYDGIDGNSRYYLGSDQWSTDNTNPDNVLLFDSYEEAEKYLEKHQWPKCVVSEFTFTVQYRSDGGIIEKCDSFKEARELLAAYENDDKANGDYEPDFYVVCGNELMDI